MPKEKTAPAPGSNNKIRVLVALSDVLLGGAIRMRLDIEPDIAVVGIVNELAEALDRARKRQADVLVLGSALLHGSSERTLKELHDGKGTVKLVLLSAQMNANAGAWASKLGLAEVVSPLESPDRLLAAIRSVKES